MTTAANIAWQQISMNTKMACGARKPVQTKEGNKLTFKVGGRQTWINVEYKPGMDLYDVSLVKAKKTKDKARSAALGITCWDENIVTLEECVGLYGDMLSEAIYGMVNK